ncbi:MAG: adenylate/guanylate cyclase domain-containing protein, partial [Alphaproteobacteria bacterium]|nr:adenylate/guanylate cyclase domain-containing protein [Alphaproteobacteria bacterium]
MRNFIPHFIQDHYLQGIFEGRFEALTLFVDVSGFTAMTQALMQGGPEGAEILATILNRVFDFMVNAVYDRGGFIPMFAGDAFTAVFPVTQAVLPADTCALHGLACADTIQAIFRRHGTQTTPFGQFTLRARVGLSQGEVQWGIAGATQKLYFFRGAAIDGCAASEQHAGQDEIVFDEPVNCLLHHGPRPVQHAWHIDADVVAPGYYRLRTKRPSGIRALPRPPRPRRKRLRKRVAAQFVPEALIEFSAMGEFRHVVSLFISFEGISTLAAFDAWAGVLLDTLATFSGYFNRMNFGDKGGFVLCGFGAPVTYEHMVDRALACILTIKDGVTGVAALAGLTWRAGITYGLAYAGIAGGQKRCEYTYHGEVVNLAARFMMKAAWGEIFVSGAVVRKAPSFRFAYKGEFAYKGITEPVPTYVLLGRKAETVARAFTDLMVGRRAELQRLHDFAAPIGARARAWSAHIDGEAGMGRSRRADALLDARTQQHALTWFT